MLDDIINQAAAPYGVQWLNNRLIKNNKPLGIGFSLRKNRIVVFDLDRPKERLATTPPTVEGLQRFFEQFYYWERL